MASPLSMHRLFIAGLTIATFFTAGCKSTPPSLSTPALPQVKHTTYHGWPDSIVLSNGQAEAVIVPAVGRIMQFRFAGETDGPLWENAEMNGKAPDPESKIWGNFGGDKTWPSPQSDWGKITPRSWPPPVAFDSMPVEAKEDSHAVTLISAVDPHYGIRATRHIQLDPSQPIMTVTTTYEKVKGEPKKVGVWVITQLKDPYAVYMPIPAASSYKEGYNLQSKETLPDLNRNNHFLILTRNKRTPYKIGNDGSTLLWIGEKTALRIDSARVPDAEYPDNGSSVEVYTSPDPLPYVELEMLGPLKTLKPGDKIERTNTYTLLRRTESTTEAEARKILAQ